MVSRWVTIFTTKNLILSGESPDFSERELLFLELSMHCFPELSTAKMTGVLPSAPQPISRPTVLAHKGIVPLHQAIRLMRCSVPAHHEGLMAPAATSISVYCLYLFTDLGNLLGVLHDFLPATILDLYNHGVR